MGRYIITLFNTDDEFHYTICKDEKELSNLLLHLDKDKYRIKEVLYDELMLEDYDTFCKKDNNLETGKN